VTRLLRPLTITILGMMLLGNANAEDGEPFSVLANTTLSCSAKLPSGLVGCYWERPVWVLGAFEVAVGIDAQAALNGGDNYIGGYGIFAYYAPTWSAWAELHLPDLAPVIGNPDWLRVGFTYRFGGE